MNRILSMFTGGDTSSGTGLSSSTVDWNKKGSVAAFVDRRWSSRISRRQVYERQWYINIAQFIGLQYHMYDERGGRFYLPPCPKHRVRLVCNRLLPIARKVISKMLRQRPRWVCIPATNDISDFQRSQVSSRVLKGYWRKLEMDEVMVDALTWMTTTGNAFMRAIWDPNEGPPIVVPPEMLIMLPREQQKAIERGLHVGDPVVSSHSPFEIDTDPTAVRQKDARDLIHTMQRCLYDVADDYGIKPGDLAPDSKSDSNGPESYLKRIRTMAVGAPFGSNDSEVDTEQVNVHSVWMKPTKAWKNGRHAIVCNGKVLHLGDLPNSFLEIPYVHLREITVPGRYWATCALEQILPQQADYNRGRSQLVEIRNVMSKPKVLNPKNSDIKKTAIDNEPGEVITYRVPYKPEFVTPPPVPDYVHRLLEYALKDIEDTTNVHEVTQARAPSGVRSGTAIATLQEQDDQVLAPAFMLLEDSLSKVGSWLLQLVADNANEERILKIVGENQKFDIVKFRGGDLRGEDSTPGINYFDVETQMGSQLPTSRSARTDYIFGLVDRGLLNAQTDQKKIMELLDLGTEEPLMNDQALDRQNARQEHDFMLKTGQPLPVNPWDDHFIHFEELQRRRKQPGYTQEETPEGQAAMEQHAQWTFEAIQQQLIQQQGPVQPAASENLPPSQDQTQESTLQA